jgi:hypothetical protein
VPSCATTTAARCRRPPSTGGARSAGRRGA